MPLSRYERKERIRYGSQREVATELGVSEADVSRVINDRADGTVSPEKAEKIREALAKRAGLSVRRMFAVQGIRRIA